MADEPAQGLTDRLLKTPGLAPAGLASIVISGAAVLVNWHVQSSQIEIEKTRMVNQIEIEKTRMEKEIALEQVKFQQDFLGKFLKEALSQDLIRKRNFAEYFATVTLNPEHRKRLKEYHLIVDNQVKTKTEARKAAAENLTKVVADVEADASERNAKAARLERQIQTIDRDLLGTLPLWRPSTLTVRCIQRALFKDQSTPIDGYFGPLTAEAITSFLQKYASEKLGASTTANFTKHEEIKIAISLFQAWIREYFDRSTAPPDMHDLRDAIQLASELLDIQKGCSHLHG